MTHEFVVIALYSRISGEFVGFSMGHHGRASLDFHEAKMYRNPTNARRGIKYQGFDRPDRFRAELFIARTTLEPLP